VKLPARITRQLREEFGLDESVFRGGSLNSVVRRRLDATSLEELEEYFQLLQQSREEFLAFADELLVPESWFFRDGKPFLWLTKWAHRWRQENKGQPLRILSVPCATGQEPYSIAITLLKEGFAPQSFHVEAGDLSARFLDDARRAEYRQIAFRGCAAEDYAEFFEDVGDGKRRVREVVRQQVTFKPRNLLAPDFLMSEPPFQIIFCRNVLIYFSACSRERAVAGLLRGLAPGGVIFSGHADALGAINQDLQPEGPSGAFCFTRRAVSPARPQRPAVKAARPAIRSAPIRREPPAKPLPPIAAKPQPKDLWAEVRELANGGRLEEANKIAEELIKQGPPTADAFSTHGEIQVGLRQYKQAEALFRRAVYLDARHADSLFHLALLAERRGDQAGAERLRKRARNASNQEVKA